MVDFLATAAWIAFYLMIIIVCCGVSTCVVLGVRKAVRRELKESGDA